MGEIGQWPYARQLGKDDLLERVEALEAETTGAGGVVDFDVPSSGNDVTIPTGVRFMRAFQSAAPGVTLTVRSFSTAGYVRGDSFVMYLPGTTLGFSHRYATPPAGFASFVLDGGASFSGPGMLRLVYDGTFWRECPSRGAGS